MSDSDVAMGRIAGRRKRDLTVKPLAGAFGASGLGLTRHDRSIIGAPSAKAITSRPLQPLVVDLRREARIG